MSDEKIVSVTNDVKKVIVTSAPKFFAVVSSGPQGPPGQPGVPGGSRYNHTQAAPSVVWIVPHNLGYEPLFATVIVNGTDVTDGVEIFHIDANSLTISFSQPEGGKAAFL